MDEIQLETIEWSVPEYNHKERGNDWFWAIGLITILACGIAIWRHNNVFAIFLALSGMSLIMFTMRAPHDVTYKIETKGLSMGKELYEWQKVKSFNIKNDEKDIFAKLIIETSKYFLPVYTIPFPKDKIDEVKANLLKVSKRSEINESQSAIFAEKIGL